MTRLVDAWREPAPRSGDLDRLVASIDALQDEWRVVSSEVARLRDQAERAASRVDGLLADWRADARARAAVAALPHARLGAALRLDGPPGERLRTSRLRAGEDVARPFSRQMGLTRCVTEAPDVCALWEGLLAAEAQCGDVLIGSASGVLDIPDATVSLAAGGPLSISVGRPESGAAPQHARCVAMPMFTYDYLPKKRRNFGHWLLDCVPQAAVLAALAPEATFLLPPPVLGFHRSTLSLVGISPERCVAWDGSPVTCERLLVLDDDGRAGGGRPLSPLMEMRRQWHAVDAAAPLGQRRIYVSRRDARAHRCWVDNQEDVEAVFRCRGFDVLTMAECSLGVQVDAFRHAAVVAGISGAGLADLVFAPPGVEVMVLHTDGLIRWYASEQGTKSAWMGGAAALGGSLAAFGDSPRFYAHLAAAFGQRCHSFVSADEVPRAALGEFVDAALDHAGRR